MKVVRDAKVEDVANKRAIDLLVSGEATLSEVQDEPPFALLDFLSGRLGDWKEIGPSAVELKSLERLSDKLVRDGRRQSLVGELQIEWQSWSDVRSRCCEIAFGTRGLGTDLRDAALACWKFHLEQKSETVSERQALPDDVLQKLGLFLINKGSLTKKGDGRRRNASEASWIPARNKPWIGSRKPWIYKRVGVDWLRFRTKLEKLEHDFDHLISELLGEGCVLCVEESQNSAVFLSPTEASRQKRSSKGVEYWYVTTGSIESLFLQSQASLAARRAGARNWMSRAGCYFAKEGRRVSAEDLKTVAKEKFKLTQNAVEEAWEKVVYPNKKKLGRIPIKEAVSISELREFN